jgi:hypothetical protein
MQTKLSPHSLNSLTQNPSAETLVSGNAYTDCRREISERLKMLGMQRSTQH